MSALAGKSGSVAVLVTINVESSLTVRFNWPGKEGGLLTSLTVTVKVFVALRGGEPLSVTTTVIVLVLGPWASVGVQLIKPLAGLMVIPIGGDKRLKVRMFAGRSGSVAEADTERVVNSSMV